MELIAIISVVLFFALLIIVAIQVNINDKTIQQRDAELLAAAQGVADEINLAYASSDGYSRTFYVKGYVLSGVYYNVSLVENSVHIALLNSQSALSVPTVNVTGYVRVGNNTIRNVNGTVYLNQG